MRLRVALAALALLGCGRLRRRHAVRREVDPRVANATACVDPRYFASSAVSLPTRGTVRDVAVAGGRGARRVAWVDDDGAHRWDFAAEHLLQSPGYRVERQPEARFVSGMRDVFEETLPGVLAYGFEARAGILRRTLGLG